MIKISNIFTIKYWLTVQNRKTVYDYEQETTQQRYEMSSMRGSSEEIRRRREIPLPLPNLWGSRVYEECDGNLQGK